MQHKGEDIDKVIVGNKLDLYQLSEKDEHTKAR